jgi:hypothetical protein
VSGDDPHVAGYLALLDAAPQTVYREKIPAGATRPYFRAYFHIEYPETESLEHRSDRAVAWLYLHCVGDNDTAASATAKAGRDVLLDVVPTVTGRTCFPIRLDHSLPPQPDETTGALVMDQVDVYRLESVPG